MDKIIQQYFHTSNPDVNPSIEINWAGHMQCGPKYSVGPRSINAYMIIFIAKGKGTVKLGDSTPIPLKESDAVFIFPGTYHHLFADPVEPFEIMWLSFNGMQCEMILSTAGFTPKQCIIPSIFHSKQKETMQLLFDAMKNHTEQNYLTTIGQFHLLLGQLINGKLEKQLGEPKSNVQKVIYFMEQNYFMDIDVNILCCIIKYSRSYLSRVFKAEAGITIPEYLNKIRIRHAKELLENSPLSIKEVASSVGITDPFYFSKVFKKETGYSPKDYRNIHMRLPAPSL